MRIAITGTPGTGKTTVSGLVDTEFSVVHLNDIIPEEELIQGYDSERGSWIADIDRVTTYVSGCTDVIFESHLAHLIPVDKVIVLRCHPHELRERLATRGEPEEKIEENVLSEAHDVILTETVDNHGQATVYEVNTTGKRPEAVATIIEEIIECQREPSVGIVSFLEEI